MLTYFQHLSDSSWQPSKPRPACAPSLPVTPYTPSSSAAAGVSGDISPPSTSSWMLSLNSDNPLSRYGRYGSKILPSRTSLSTPRKLGKPRKKRLRLRPSVAPYASLATARGSKEGLGPLQLLLADAPGSRTTNTRARRQTREETEATTEVEGQRVTEVQEARKGVAHKQAMSLKFLIFLLLFLLLSLPSLSLFHLQKKVTVFLLPLLH